MFRAAFGPVVWMKAVVGLVGMMIAARAPGAMALAIMAAASIRHNMRRACEWLVCVGVMAILPAEFTIKYTILSMFKRLDDG